MASGDDATVRTRFVGVGGDEFIWHSMPHPPRIWGRPKGRLLRVVGFKVQIALDRKAEFAAYRAKLEKAHVAEIINDAVVLYA